MRNWMSSIFIVVMLSIVDGQETLYGLPPLPNEPLPSTTTQLPTTHRMFRFGPFLPFMHHAALPHPTLPPFLAHPFDTYNNINPIPELPPQPESKYNGYYDLDGNFVSYGSDGARGYAARRPKREVDSKDEALRQKLLEEEYAYDDEDQKSTASTTPKSTTITINTKIEETTSNTSPTNILSTTQISITSNSTESNVINKSTPTQLPIEVKPTQLPIEVKPTQLSIEVKPTQLPTRPLFVSGNARPRHHSNIVQNDMPQIKPKVQNKLIDHNVTFKAQNSRPLTPYRVNKKPTQISSQQFAKGLVVPRQHQRPIQKRPSPNLQSKFINTHKRTRRPKFPTRRPAAFTRKPLKTHQRQFQPAPLKVAPQLQNQFPLQQQPPQFIPYQQQRAWAAPAVSVIPDNREPQVIAYLRDVEDYDWTYTGERPNLEGPVQAFQRENGVTAPETLLPLNNRQQALIGTTLSPYIPPRVTQPPSYTAPAPFAQTPSYTLALVNKNVRKLIPSKIKAFSNAGADPFGFFSGTPNPVFDVRRLFSGGLFGGR